MLKFLAKLHIFSYMSLLASGILSEYHTHFLANMHIFAYKSLLASGILSGFLIFDKKIALSGILSPIFGGGPEKFPQAFYLSVRRYIYIYICVCCVRA